VKTSSADAELTFTPPRRPGFGSAIACVRPLQGCGAGLYGHGMNFRSAVSLPMASRGEAAQPSKSGVVLIDRDRLDRLEAMLVARLGL
jgi:hypothetical protein